MGRGVAVAVLLAETVGGVAEVAERLVVRVLGVGDRDRRARERSRRQPLGLQRGRGELELEVAVAVGVPADLIERVDGLEARGAVRLRVRTRAEQTLLLAVEQHERDGGLATRHVLHVARDREHERRTRRIVVGARAVRDRVEVRAHDDRVRGLGGRRERRDDVGAAIEVLEPRVVAERDQLVAQVHADGLLLRVEVAGVRRERGDRVLHVRLDPGLIELRPRAPGRRIGERAVASPRRIR